LADLTGDGKADIIGFGTAGVYVALNNGDGTFQAPRLVLQDSGTASTKWRPVVTACTLFVADVNGSGYGDIVGNGRNGEGVFVAIGNGDGTFQAFEHVNNNLGHIREPQFFVDLTGDGAADLIYVSFLYYSSVLLVSYNDGSGNFGPAQEFFRELPEHYSSMLGLLMANL
jgi:hypothetical protein